MSSALRAQRLLITSSNRLLMRSYRCQDRALRRCYHYGAYGALQQLEHSNRSEDASRSALHATGVLAAAVGALWSLQSTQCDAAKDAEESDAEFQVMAALEMKEETQKIRLAQVIHDLHELARGESVDGEKTTGLRRYVTMVGKLTRRVTGRAATVARKATQDAIPFDGNPRFEGGNISLEGVDLTGISPQIATQIITSLRNGGRFDKESLLRIVAAVTKFLQNDSTVIDLRGVKDTITVVGDLHGSLPSLTYILNLVGDDIANRILVFDGDFVDRGERGVEVLCTLIILKLCYPKNVVLLRGNHEDDLVASVYGFQDEIREKYGAHTSQDIWELMVDLFAALPIAARTDSALIVHGGIPSEDFTIESLEAISTYERFQMKTTIEPKTPEEDIISGVLWSDPTSEHHSGIWPSHRGVGVLFGTKVARDFLDRYNLKYLVRGHEMVKDGTRIRDCGHQRSVITVFSAAAYPCEEGTNMGGIVHLNGDGGYRTESFYIEEALKRAKKSSKIHSLVRHNKKNLEQAFNEVADEGRIAIAEWAKIMAKTLDLQNVPWTTLQPTLAPTFGEDLIDWKAFLELHTASIAEGAESGEYVDESQTVLLTVFKYLDFDRDGSLSLEDFKTGVTLLNKRSPADRQLKNPDELFASMSSGSDKISFEDFKRGFKSGLAEQFGV
jgi:diadenosine tetraphosphatase ApaH/serine/threonine PP2A family protein phosphatase/Ca2+-binding EF-hand superfamily protein